MMWKIMFKQKGDRENTNLPGNWNNFYCSYEKLLSGRVVDAASPYRPALRATLPARNKLGGWQSDFSVLQSLRLLSGYGVVKAGTRLFNEIQKNSLLQLNSE